MEKKLSPLHTDIKENSWFENYIPRWIIPYLRLARVDRPIGVWLLLFPSLWGLVAASDQPPSLYFLALFIGGAIVTRGAGCAYNDLVDCDLDAKVTRSSFRPLPSGLISKKQAIAFLILQLVIGFLILIQLPPLTIGLGIAAIALILIYPWLKRITYWPQLFLGLTFNWGSLMAWSAVQNSLDWPAFLLYGAGIFWTLHYDTIYAHQDREDDLRAGIKSTALKLGKNTKFYLFIFCSLSTLGFCLAGWRLNINSVFYGGIVLAALHFLWQIKTLDINNPQDCLDKFKSNQWIGWIMLLGILGAKKLWF